MTTYLVTGGSGFLGFAILKMLRDRRPDNVSKIIVLDLSIPPELKKEIESVETDVSFNWIEKDITDAAAVTAAMKNCDVVLHLASIIPGRAASDEVMWNVNVNGTQNIVDACIENGVSRLVYISSYNVIGPNSSRQPCTDVNENTIYAPGRLPIYSRSKKAAEDIVLRANKSNKKLVTCSLRAGTVYGEDYELMKKMLKACFRKTFVAIFPRDSVQSYIYVENLAWATLSAAEHLEMKKDLVGGEAYFLKDDTPDCSHSRLWSDVLRGIGYKLSREPIVPFWIIYMVFWILHSLSTILTFFRIPNKRNIHPEYLYNASIKFTISNCKFIEHFNFEPTYSYNESINRTRRYLRALVETNFKKRIYRIEE